jgi:hypothetical protein
MTPDKIHIARLFFVAGLTILFLLLIAIADMSESRQKTLTFSWISGFIACLALVLLISNF